MSKKRILFVDDDVFLLNGLRRLLRSCRKEWEMEFYSSGEEVLGSLREQPADVVVSDMRMPGMDGEAVLSAVRAQHPGTIRIILSGQSEKEAAFRTVGPAHQYLTKPCNGDDLKRVVRRACALGEHLNTERLLGFVQAEDLVPKLSNEFIEIVHMVQDPESAAEDIARKIEADTILSSELLAFANCPSCSHGEHAESIVEVVRRLGVDGMRPLLLAARFFADFAQQSSSDVESLRNEAVTVSCVARRIASSHSDNLELAEHSAIAGLLSTGRHLMPNPPTIDPGEIAAYVLEQWGLPAPIIEALAFLHVPSETIHRDFEPLTATYIATSWVAELEDAYCSTEQEAFDQKYIEEVGVHEHLPTWKAKFASELCGVG